MSGLKGIGPAEYGRTNDWEVPAGVNAMRRDKRRRAENLLQEELMEKLRLDRMVDERLAAYGES